MKRARYLFMLLTLLVSVTMSAQKQNYSGKVVDEAGEPITGASVIKKGTSEGVVTDLDGRFSINGEPGTVLVVSFMGYVTREQRATPNMSIVLKEDTKTLSDVVVIGYGVHRKSKRGGPRRQNPPTRRRRTERYGCGRKRDIVLRTAWFEVDDSYPWYRNHQQFRTSLYYRRNAYRPERYGKRESKRH